MPKRKRGRTAKRQVSSKIRPKAARHSRRPNSKQAQVLALLRRPSGVTIATIMRACVVVTYSTTASETRQILTNLKQLLDAAGSSLDKVVKVNVLLHSMLEEPNMNEVYAHFFPDQPPARTVCGARLPDGVKVIVECTALA
jgi:enamine deaminase RidA (YjgF/YER057c/UK114 family)